MQPERPPQQQPQRRSNSAKLSFGIMGVFGCDLSEKSLKNLAKCLTSKLNTRVRFPSPAPINPVTWRSPDRIQVFSVCYWWRQSYKASRGKAQQAVMTNGNGFGDALIMELVFKRARLGCGMRLRTRSCRTKAFGQQGRRQRPEWRRSCRLSPRRSIGSID